MVLDPVLFTKAVLVGVVGVAMVVMVVAVGLTPAMKESHF
jgi:hypothetical protein